ncbi:MAG: OmpH family outer membrane protein [Planctomycetes bacterium]|nr:OmpH family outer membrane protein [Planctomycetota bacterium]
MKRTLIVLAGVVALIAGAYGSTYLLAQGGGAPAQPVVQQGTKIAVVNIGQVFNQYKRAQAFKAELEQTLKPFKDKAKALSDENQKYEAALQQTTPPLDATTRIRYQDLITKNKRDLEDMSKEISRLLGKKQEDNLVTLWKEVNMGIDAVAKAYGFQIVLGYGDPIEKELLHQFPNVNRKMQAMDLGSTVPLYIHGSVDLSPIIVQTLNKWLEPQGGVAPAGGGK